MEEGMEEYLDIYVEEADELLTNLNKSLMSFEKNPKDKTHLESIARSAHTLKSSSAAMGFTNISELSHRMEDLFNKLQEAEGVESSEGLVNILFQCFDALQTGVEKVKAGQDEPCVDVLLEKLEECMALDVEQLSNLKVQKSDVVEGIDSDRPQSLQMVQFVKVDIDRLDKLVNLTGEILTQKMRLKSINSIHHIPDFNSVISQLDILIQDLQYEVTEARMIPVGQVFNRFPRMVRDIAKKEGKKVDFQMEGQDMKLDRTILDQLGEPLIHLLRNSVDHGIEEPDKREKQGKNPIGKIKLIARRERNSALIEIIDDGDGFDPEAIKASAISKGFLTKTEIEGMTENDIIMLPFMAGFSTNEKVTDVSGRGVGLDVVKKTIEGMNGSVNVESKKGSGSKFILELPLTLSIVKSLLVTVAGEKFVIPIANVLKVIRIKDGILRHIEGNEVLVLREDKIPLKKEYIGLS